MAGDDRRGSEAPLSIDARPAIGRARLAARFLRFGLVSARQGWHDFARTAARAELQLAAATAKDVVGAESVRCPICGWRGAGFYPNVGPGFVEPSTTCPGCGCQDRHRSLTHVLERCTPFLEPHTRVVEVAPMRGFQRWCLEQPALDYVSFDIARHAMTRGDITAMRFASSSVDVFICFHVLEHIPDEAAALGEIHRVLRPGGVLVAQVPLDASQPTTVEYDAPDPRETNHVRRYGSDFGDRMAAYGFSVGAVSVADVLPPEQVAREGLSTDPIYLGTKTV